MPPGLELATSRLIAASLHVHREVSRWIPSQDYSASFRDSTLVNLPSCHLPRVVKEKKSRFLGQISSSVIFTGSDGPRLDASIKQMLRDHVRYVDRVWEIAAKVVTVLGPFRFSSLHIRRNDLQFKKSYAAASETLDNVEPLLLRCAGTPKL